MAAKRFELLTLRVWTACSSQLSYAAVYMELITRFELVTSSLPRMRSTNWAISAYQLGCGKRTWTSDLRVMSPTSYLLLHPAILKWWAGMDSNHRSLRRRIYSPFPLTTRAPTHFISWCLSSFDFISVFRHRLSTFMYYTLIKIICQAFFSKKLKFFYFFLLRCLLLRSLRPLCSFPLRFA